ncbi:hypothetical protein JXA48_02045 [Candidatus Woesearchaeota archaeon]|nr:hypothetical protein [Candidatus Woesearchaeota archaeon]
MGLIDVNVNQQAKINFNLEKNFSEVYVGDSTTFKIENKEYSLIITRISFITSSIEFNIYEQ